MNTTFSIVNLGCKVNRVEADEVAAFLSTCGWKSALEDEADFIIVNTCTVTGEAEAKSRKAVRHALSCQPTTLFVTGCDMAIHQDFYESLDSRIRCVDKENLRSEVEAFVVDSSSLLPQAEESSLRLGVDFRSRVAIKIQDGCNHACTYCLVHIARGKARSVPASIVLNECKAYLEAGAREIVITGIDVGSYLCPETGMTLTDLLRLMVPLLEAQSEFCRIRLSSIEPMSFTDDLIMLAASAEGRICRHFHLPLQSGSTAILRAMERPYTQEMYLELVRRIYKAMPNASLTTDVIVGFPGEDEADNQATYDVCREVGFTKMHVFPFSAREGTPAASYDNQIAPEEKSNRARRLRILSDELARADREKRSGSKEYAFVESSGRATTESYHKVAVPDSLAVGHLVEFLL